MTQADDGIVLLILRLDQLTWDMWINLLQLQGDNDEPTHSAMLSLMIFHASLLILLTLIIYISITTT